MKNPNVCREPGAWSSLVTRCALLLMLTLAAACGGDSGGGGGGGEGMTTDTSNGTSGMACASSEECGGGLCLLDECRACVDDAACAGDSAYGAGATCVDGACQSCLGDEGCGCDAGSCGDGLVCENDTCVVDEGCTEGEENCNCFANDSCLGDLTCQEGVCLPCPEGEQGCACFSNNTCMDGLRCEDEACAVCPPGEEACPCDAGDVCGEGLACMEGLCAPESCEEGAEGCPCGDDDTCDEGLTCSDGGMCAPCMLDIEGCPCDDACEGGLVCDEDEAACRAALACEELECAENQLCEEGEEGEDAACLEECEEGFTYNADTETCDAMVVVNCMVGAAGSILAQCQEQNRECVAMNGTAMCGDCATGFLEENGACREAVQCMALNCAAENRDCVAATSVSDATCGGCSMGYEENNGACEAIPQANCMEGADLSILAECQAQNRACDLTDTGAECGACESGYVENMDTSTCEVELTCQAIDCESLGRDCDENGEGAHATCTDCLDGAVQDEDNPEACRALVTCAEIADDCEAQDKLCVEEDGVDAVCSNWPCVYPDGEEDFESAYREDTDACVFCGNSCDGEGLTGRIWPYTREQSNQCVCETEDGYYFDVSGALLALPCDADGDGWVRSSAESFVESSEEALSANARCDVKTIDRFRLINEYQQELDVFICNENEFVPGYACTDNDDCGDAGRCNNDGICECVIPATLDLYETVRNDDQLELLDANALDVPSYEDTAGRGRQLVAGELNPLTRACITANGDYNDNGQADITEWHGIGIAGADARTTALTQFAFFMELHEGYHQGIIGSEVGRYVIREKSRCEDDFLLKYNTTIDPGAYWKSCTRNRDASYDATLDNALIGFDFAQWSCTSPIEDCPLPPPPTDVTADGEVPSHGLCDAGVTLPPVDGVWRGMNHHSQFKCVQMVTTLPDDRDSQQPHKRLASDITNSTGTVGSYQLNRCNVACPEGDASCASDCTDGECMTTSEVAEDGARRPLLSCEAITRDEAEEGEVGFASVRYIQADNYVRGCIDEWSPTVVVEEALPWKSLCPGYASNPAGVSAQANPGDFGKLVCGCGFNYGGANCDEGCIGEQLHYGGADATVQGDCDNSYCAVTAEGDGGRLGYWMCGATSSTSYTGTDEGVEPALRSDGWVIQGSTSTHGIETTRLCQDGEDCSNGWSLTK